MPESSSAELHKEYMEARVPVCDQANDVRGQNDKHDHPGKSQLDHLGHNRSDSVSQPNFRVHLMPSSSSPSSTSPIKTCSATLDTPPTSLKRLPSSPPSPSLPSEASLPSLSILSSDNSSSFASEDGPCLKGWACTPQEVKEVFLRDEDHCAVAEQEIGWADDNDSLASGVSKDSEQELPVYCDTADKQKSVQVEHIKTIIGCVTIQRPFDTCFGIGWDSCDGVLPLNRTFANEFIAVDKSPLQGYGIFAAVDIEQYTHVLLEQSFFRVERWEQISGEYAGLGDQEKAVFDGLAGYHREHEDPVIRNFELFQGRQGILAIASNFNHACHSRRNTQYAWDAFRQVMTFTAMKDIKKGEEMLISYDSHRCTLYSMYGFICHCGGCENQEYEG